MEQELFKASQKLNKLDFNISFEGLSVSVFWFRAMILSENKIISRHRHSSFEFHAVKEGACRVILDGGEYIFNAGEMYIMPPNDLKHIIFIIINSAAAAISENN